MRDSERTFRTALEAGEVPLKKMDLRSSGSHQAVQVLEWEQ